MDNNKETQELQITLKLEEKHVSVILQCLTQLRWDLANPIIGVIKAQTQDIVAARLSETEVSKDEQVKASNSKNTKG